MFYNCRLLDLLQTTFLLIIPLKNCRYENSNLDWLLTNNIYLWITSFLNMRIVNISAVKISTFIATIYLKGLLLRKRHEASLVQYTHNKNKST